MSFIDGFNRGLQKGTNGVQDYAKEIPTVAPPNLGNVTSNYDYLIGDEHKFKGTVHSGGISYSGADIKIVVNVYDTTSQARKKWMDKQMSQRDLLDSDLRNAESERNRYQNLHDNSHYGTTDYHYANAGLSAAQTQERNAQDQIQQIDDNVVRELKQLGNKPPTVVLAEAQTLSITSFRDKAPVRSLGSVYPKGYSRGPRQIGGSLVFTVFDRDVLYDFLEAHPSDFDGNRSSSAVLDQLPPVDIIVSFASELGSVSRMAIYGVEFISSGQIMSIEDMITENVVEYVARDYDPMSKVGTHDLNQIGEKGEMTWATKSASDILNEEGYKDVKGSVDPFVGFKRRNNPFL